ncbi:family 2 glycosyl transferase [Salinisphaera sp. PC39]|uniref:glycosyltransferase family 2 protein n=1 Tax=Salinisphaera sp. PC39 TaxID=1304156 RepID=UPI003340D403
MRKIETAPAKRLSEPVNLPLSVNVVTLNEAANLGRCLESVCGLAAEIVVIDSGSTDGTREIAERYGARFIHNDWPGMGAQKNVALEHCTQPWVLCLDADEALDETLQTRIVETLSGTPQYDGYAVNRLTWFLGDWVRHSWFPEWRVRLARRDKARWEGVNPHEWLAVDGRTARLDGFLPHYPVRDLAHHLDKTLGYGRISGAELVKRRRRIPQHKLIFSPLWRLVRTLLLKGGWRDGWRGLVIAYTSMFSAILKYAYAMEATRVRPRDDLPNDPPNDNTPRGG